MSTYVQFRSAQITNSAPSTRRSQLRSAPAVLILILVNVLVFRIRDFSGGWNDPDVLHRIGALEPISGHCATRILAPVHRAFSTCRFLHLAIQPFRALCSWVRRSNARSARSDF